MKSEAPLLFITALIIVVTLAGCTGKGENPAPETTPAVTLEGPLQATALSENRIGTLTFSLKLLPGREPEDMSRMTFHLYENSGQRTTDFYNAKNQSVQISWRNTTGWANSLLEEGEIATVSLDLRGLGYELSPREINSGLTIHASGFGTPTYSFTWCRYLPETLVNGTVYEC